VALKTVAACAAYCKYLHLPTITKCEHTQHRTQMYTRGVGQMVGVLGEGMDQWGISSVRQRI